MWDRPQATSSFWKQGERQVILPLSLSVSSPLSPSLLHFLNPHHNLVTHPKHSLGHYWNFQHCRYLPRQDFNLPLNTATRTCYISFQWHNYMAATLNENILKNQNYPHFHNLTPNSYFLFYRLLSISTFILCPFNQTYLKFGIFLLFSKDQITVTIWYIVDTIQKDLSTFS